MEFRSEKIEICLPQKQLIFVEIYINGRRLEFSFQFSNQCQHSTKFCFAIRYHNVHPYPVNDCINIHQYYSFSVDTGPGADVSMFSQTHCLKPN